MKELLIRWIGKHEGQIDAYKHIHDAINRHDFNAKQIQGLCMNMIEQIEPTIEKDKTSLNELTAKQ